MKTNKRNNSSKTRIIHLFSVFFLFSTFVGISKCAFHSADNLYTISKDSKNDNNIPGDQDRLVGMAANPSAAAGN